MHNAHNKFEWLSSFIAVTLMDTYIHGGRTILIVYVGVTQAHPNNFLEGPVAIGRDFEGY